MIRTHFKVFFLTAFLIFFAVFSSLTAQASLLDVIKALVTINPMGVVVSAPAEVEVGKTFKVEAEVQNKGSKEISNAKAKIFLPADGLVLNKKDAEKELGAIQGFREKKAVWPVKGETVGSYIIYVSASGELDGQVIGAEGNSVVVEVLKKIRPTRNNSELFSKILDIFRAWFKSKTESL